MVSGRVLILMPALLLGACAGPEFEFRGITNRSSCASAVAAEKERGSIPGEQRATQNTAVRDASVYELAGELFEENVRILIVCEQEQLLYINYLTELESESEAEYLHQYFESRLAETFGGPAQLQAPGDRLYGAEARKSGGLPGRYASYWCREGNVSLKVLSDLKYRDISEYSVAVVLDFKSGIACPQEGSSFGG